MNKGFESAIESLGELILEMKTKLKVRDYEIEAAKKEIERLKGRLEELEKSVEVAGDDF